MRIVIDTNVLVSALLNAGRVPDVVVGELLRRRDIVLYDGRVLAEYREVLARPKLGFSPARAQILVSALVASGHGVGAVAPWQGAMIDGTDRVFVEVALAGKADVLLTGNARHYPRNLGFEVMGPTALLGTWHAMGTG